MFKKISLFLMKSSAVFSLSIISVASALASSSVTLRETDETAMMAAIDRGDLSYVTTELKSGSLSQKMDHVDHKGRSLLERASARGHKDLALLLIENGAHINHQDFQGHTSLYWACQEGHQEVTDFLLTRGADPNLIPSQGLSPLYLASKRGDAKVVTLLCQAGAHLLFTSTSQETSLWIAAKKGHLDVVTILITQSLLKEDSHNLLHQTDKKGISPLLIASYQGHKEVAEFLLNQGARPNQGRDNGITPLMVTSAQGHPLLVELLLSHGASVTQRASAQVGGGTALDYAHHHHQVALLPVLEKAKVQEEQAQQKTISTPEKGGLDLLLTDLKPLIANPQLLEALATLKAHFKDAPSPEAWRTEIPIQSIADVLAPSEQQALQQVDKIVADYNAKYAQSIASLSRFTRARQKVSKAFSKAFQVTKEVIQGPDINSLLMLQRRVNEAYGAEVLKLDQSRLEENHKKRLAALSLTHQLQEKDLEHQQEEVRAQLKASPQRRLELRLQAKDLADQLATEEVLYHTTLTRLQNPLHSALEDFYDWKRSVFYDFMKLHFGTYLITYEALALGTVARHPEAYEQVLQGTTTLASIVSDAFLPLGGLLGNVIGTVVQTGTELYADKQMRVKAAKIGSLYSYRGLEGMVELSQEVAEGLLYRLKEAILPITPHSLEKLAKVASTQMIDYALKQWNDNQNQVVTASDLLLRSTQHQPSWFKALTEGATLETEDGRSLDGWALLTQSHQVELEEGRFKRAARSFAKQARKNGANFIGYANTTTSTLSGLVGF